MNVARLFSIGFGAFSLLFTFLLGRQLLLRGFSPQKQRLQIWHEPEDLLLLIVTLIVGSRYGLEFRNNVTSGRLPDIAMRWLVAFGCSCAFYLGAKLIRVLKLKIH
jgi:hypothetical protein